MTALSDAKTVQYYDPKLKCYVRKIPAGEIAIGFRPDEALGTILGSCVAACVRDPEAGVGGINHFMLPGDRGIDNLRYGSHAMEMLINSLLKVGAVRSRLEVKVFGGADLCNQRTRIGTQNVDFVRKYLKDERFKIISEDLGGEHGRRIYYYPTTGKVLRQFLGKKDEEGILDREDQLRVMIEKQVKLEAQEQDQEVELF